METINFYRVRDEYGWMSNFYMRTIIIDGKPWRSTEHFFQAQKFAGTAEEEVIRHAKTCREAADMGRDPRRRLRSDWQQVKERCMSIALFAKFTQHHDLCKQLLETRDAILVEHTSNDSYWGDGGDGTGKNRLGHGLMFVREVISRAGIVVVGGAGR